MDFNVYSEGDVIIDVTSFEQRFGEKSLKELREEISYERVEILPIITECNFIFT